MMSKIIVSDTTPIIALEKIEGGFDFIKKVFDKILVPIQVLEEISTKEISKQVYLFKNGIHELIEESNPTKILIFNQNQNLDEGEKYAIALAVEKNYHYLFMKEKGEELLEN